MKYDKNSYKQVVNEYTPKNKMLRNCVYAFIFGGAICLLGEVIKNIFMNNFGTPEQDASTISSVVLIAITALLTGLGWFDKLSKIAGAGTAVPITGFANAVVSPALEFKREGFILGTASNIFKLAGPVLLFGYFASFIVGILSLMFK
ncbi:stage V sporulation protein AC [Sedimentibacter hydroxybenzoicus DSM 7310]|uniref:Stage V sporulation protein AC n=1 Tax=Sedimentibacter hydroxybenzoicus DSM 7310 TaxID=1123245 RepID=A0A974BN34_SEDHY|nr:stage V sporulation protein AC [Sedimentibacter hydroxybenzoicus]NYB76018.1 stage V sporulation protein AC [Sedimentibacter hydroxybenzoicus DSM 7310]